jgi:hypothetical protein
MAQLDFEHRANLQGHEGQAPAPALKDSDVDQVLAAQHHGELPEVHLRDARRLR